MKKIIYILAVIASFSMFTSCVQDEKEIFNDSANDRLDKAVKNYKDILESSPNGWHMVLWTGADYSGGGYNMFIKFNNGKVTIQSDIAPDSMICKSDYTIGTNQGPVLSFNTFNTILHYMANPSAELLSGREGDFEFVIQRATNDSIFLKGLKWGNKTVLTRVNEDVKISEAILKMQVNLKSIAGYYGDENDFMVVDPSTRLFYMNNRSYGVPYVPTDEGIALLTPVYSRKHGQISSLSASNSFKELKTASTTFTYYVPDGYQSIDFWHGDWQIGYLDGNTLSNAKFDVNFEYSSDLIGQKSFGALDGSFMIEGWKFEFIVYYSPITGGITIPAQYIQDPSGTYGLFLLLGVDASKENGWYTNDWYTEYDSEADKYKLTTDALQADGEKVSSMQLLLVDNNGYLVGNSDGLPISLISLPFIDYITKK